MYTNTALPLDAEGLQQGHRPVHLQTEGERVVNGVQRRGVNTTALGADQRSLKEVRHGCKQNINTEQRSAWNTLQFMR